MLAANTAWLVPNTTKKPLNDRAFRKALATSINVGRIVQDDYGNIVSKANRRAAAKLEQVVDQAQVEEPRLQLQRREVEGAPRRQRLPRPNSDGFVEDKDGATINLRLIVPNGWSDWMTAIQMIADSAKDAGIRSRRHIPTSTASSTSATRASSTS